MILRFIEVAGFVHRTKMMAVGADLGNNIDIRRATPADVRLLSVLATTTFYEAYFEQDDPHNLAEYISDSFNIERLAAELTRQELTFFIAYLGAHAVGYAKLDATSRHPSIVTARTIELKRIYAVERVWGRGIGEAMLSHCGQFAIESGCESIWLGVWQQNERGRRFYNKHGFVKRGTLEFPYGEEVGINDVMEKMLK